MAMNTFTTFKANPDGSKADHAKNALDSLPVPGEHPITQLTNGQLASLLMAANVVGVKADNGRSANLEAYERHLKKIHEAAGQKAVAEWVRSKS